MKTTCLLAIIIAIGTVENPADWSIYIQSVAIVVALLTMKYWSADYE